ncbi:LLM class flavin-dependent oxidoreductase [Pseudonocardia thermophila]|uniref:LLM class flavin-dependent oxidoreductase n=1 Tax=Pseudonocardia thermophila TaxID=1848 RepID=UPI00248E9438|nr:LLM class flavin-dependent oxidoreductase [Pseudonocardia thermophila]
MADFVLGIALPGPGAHPGAARVPGPAPTDAAALRALATAADAAGVDLLVAEDPATAPPGSVRLDPAVLLARLAPATRRIGLVAQAAAGYTEPFHVATALATLDHISAGRAGWLLGPAGEAEAALHGVPVRPEAELAEDTEDVLAVVRALCLSWEPDAVIRDVATGRYLDRNRIHHVDFTGRYFSITGPSITPRSPQGVPLTLVRAGSGLDGDLVLGDGPGQLAELVVTLGATPADAARLRTRLDGCTAGEAGFVGTPEELAEHIVDRYSHVRGVILRPAHTALVAPLVAEAVAPALRRRGVLPEQPAEAPTLKERLLRESVAP